jgi:hypothetical protein
MTKRRSKLVHVVATIIIFCISFSALMANDVYVKISQEDYQNASLKLKNELVVIASDDDLVLVTCSASGIDMFDEEHLGYEIIESYDHLIREELPPMPNGGIPLGVVVGPGSQGIAGWHEGVAMAGSVLAYMETYVDGQLPGFTFWDMEKDSVWHYYIDTDLNGNEPLFMSASDNKIYYTYHYWGETNSAMLWYWYDVNTGEHGEIENFGYGFEGFGVSDTWVMRVGSKGSGWNNQIFAHNIETGERFEMLADSIPAEYKFDSFGGPKTDGNTIVFTYTNAADDWSVSLRVFSLGADGIKGTADDIGGTICSTATSYDQYRVDGRYIVWTERTPADEGNVRAYDMGEDELYGTADDEGIIEICADASKQATVRIDDNIIVWEDWRNVSAGGTHDIYGYDLNTSTEFRSTPSPDSLTMVDIVKDDVIMIKPDWESPGKNDIYFANITGRIQSDYYRIDILNAGNPQAMSLLTGDLASAPYNFTNIIAAAKGPLGAIFVKDLPSGNDIIMSYSAVTGDWSSELIYFPADGYTVMMDGDNGLIVGKTNLGYEAWTFNGATGTFSSKKSNIVKPTGFAVGKNIAFVWTDDDRTHYFHTYDAERDAWTTETGTSNDPWHVITTEFSDSLGLLVTGDGDTVCTHINMTVYDLNQHDWVPMDNPYHSLHQLNRLTYKSVLKIKLNDHFAVAAHEYDYYYDYIYTHSTGADEWKIKTTPVSYDLDKPLLGENFVVQGCRSGDLWQGHIYNDCTGEWLPEYIESMNGITGLKLFRDLMIAWYVKEPPYAVAKLWAYSSAAENIQRLDIQNPGDYFKVEAASKAAFVYAKGDIYTRNFLYVFNGIKGEWKEPLFVSPYNRYDLSASGHTGIFLEWVGQTNGSDNLKAHGYSAFRDEWDVIDIRSNNVDGIQTSDYCGFLSYNHYYWQTTKYIHAFNSIEGEWSKDILQMHYTLFTGLSMNERIMLVVEDNPSDYTYAKVHVFSPILNMWNTTIFDTQYDNSLEGYSTTPTSAFAWNGKQFRIIFSNQTDWDIKTGQLDELHVTDYAIAATLYHTSQYNTYYFYPPRTEIINKFEITDGPNVDIKSSWTAEITWKTNMYADTRLVWGVDGYYEIIEKDTMAGEFTKDHRVVINGLEANKTYYYGAISIISEIDTVHSDTLMFSTGADNTAPALTGPPEAYRIHDDQASVWWATDEPSTPIIQWGLTTDYTDSLEFNDAEPYITNAVRLYDLEKDATYHYRVGGYDRYGNGPFYSGDYTFRTHNELPVVTDLQQADSTLYGAAYMTWEPPRLDSSMSREKFDYGIPVDWKIYNRGDNQKGSTWTSGYIGDNPVAYCPYGDSGERQEEWLISNPITIDGTTGGVLNFWHMGFYNDYDNAPNKVMVSWTGTDRSDFTTVWSSQSLPDNWALVQINLNYSANYGKTMYIAFVYESTYGETWAIDNVYMDFDIDGYYENFDDLSGWTNAGGRWGLYSIGGNYAMGVEGIKEATALPDPIQTWDAWEVSPFFKVTESHHILGFWQMGWAGEYDTKPNEIRVVHSTYSIEASSEVVRTVYPVPNGWMWTTVDLGAYIGQTIMIGFRYNSNVGWWWNGTEWLAFWGEDWYIDDLYLFENAPAMVADPNAKPNEKPLKFASSPNGKPIDLGQFKSISPTQTMPVDLASEAPEGSIDLPKEKPLKALSLPKVNSKPAPSVLAEPKPELLGYEVYGRYPWEAYFSYLGYVTSPSFVDWGTYLGYECEYYVEAVYDQGNSQPSNKAMIAGGTKYAENEYGYDTGILYYSYWWYPGKGFANEFDFTPDSVLYIEKIKVHIANPGSFKISVTYFDHDVYYTETTATINATEEGWVLVDPPGSLNEYFSNYFYVEFQPQDTLVQLSYDDYDCGYSWYNGIGDADNSPSDKTFYIRLIGEKLPYVGVADIPDEFNLAQNYPNPFNPTTTVEFDIPEASDVDIRIYDIRGALVKTLASGHHEAGRYQMIWDAKNMTGADVASGVYLIKMTAGDFTETKKMVLVR